MPTTCIAKLIASLAAISDEESVQIASHFVPRKIKKKEILLREGAVSAHVFFVQRGLLRNFVVSKTGEEFTTDFIAENQLLTELMSLRNKSSAVFSIQAIEDGVVYTISAGDLDYICEHYPSGMQFSRLLAEIQLERLVHRYVTLKVLSVSERFENFKSLYPHILERAPQYMVASFLGISRPSLHRLRASYRKIKSVS